MTGVTPTNTFTYVYDESWKDQLVEVKKNGSTEHTITYDDAGNPARYKGAVLTWRNGRNLYWYRAQDSDHLLEMKYSADGTRVRKTREFDDESTPEIVTYVYSGSNLVYEKEELSNKTRCKYFLYNNQGVIGFVYNTTTYMFRKNLFGDITAIYRGGTKVAEYRYDAWGNCVVIDPSTGLATDNIEFIGHQNPFRYRGYYWDSDLQLYYLMSRYYDPATGRFINADSLEYLDPETIGGLNLYSYCGNNPVMDIDPEGTSTFQSIFKIVASVVLVTVATIGAIYTGNVQLAGAAIGGTIGAVTNIILDASDGEMDLESIADSMFSGATTGAASGFLAATGVGLGGQIVGNALITSADYIVTKWAKGEQLDLAEFSVAAFSGAVAGLSGGAGLLDPATNSLGKLMVSSITRQGAKRASEELITPIFKAGWAAIYTGVLKNIISR